MQRCSKCKKHLLLNEFVFNPKKKKPFSMCEPCRDYNRASMKKFRESDHGKAVIKAYFSTPEGKAARKRVNDSASTRAIQKRYWAANGRRVQRNFRKTAKGIDHQKRCSKARCKKIASRADLKLRERIRIASNHIIVHGRKSTVFASMTSFSSSTAFRKTLQSTFRGSMTLGNYGTAWQIDHKIPQQAYDFNNPVDVSRCWSPSNVHALTKEENTVKSWKIIDAMCEEAGEACYPVAWGGSIPNDEEKEALHTRFRKGLHA
jgi:hypothetical protein